MQKVLVITVKGDHKYQIGIDKSVDEVIREIEACKSPFYKVIDVCAVKISEIVSIEQFEYDPEEINEDDQT